jgi:hypothetical protein
VVVGTNEGGDIVSLVRGCNLPLEQLYDDERDPEGDVLVEPTG